MTTISQYVKVMRDAQADAARRLGMDLATTDKAFRIAALSALAVQAVVVKALVDKGVITDTELLTALNAMRASGYRPAEEPVNPAPWDTTPVTGVG
jgi:hypothetical protein